MPTTNGPIDSGSNAGPSFSQKSPLESVPVVDDDVVADVELEVVAVEVAAEVDWVVDAEPVLASLEPSESEPHATKRTKQGAKARRYIAASFCRFGAPIQP
jgi:hypothetical protein